MCFEPDQEKCEKLIKKKNYREVIFPHALFGKKKLNLQLTKSCGCSSIYQPNNNLLNMNMSFIDEIFNLTAKIAVITGIAFYCAVK